MCWYMDCGVYTQNRKIRLRMVGKIVTVVRSSSEAQGATGLP